MYCSFMQCSALQGQEDAKSDLESLGAVFHGQFVERGLRFQAVKKWAREVFAVNRLWLVLASDFWQ